MAANERSTPRIGIIPGVWFRTDSPLGAADRYVLALFAIHASRDDRECWPSQQQIADEGKIDRKTVNRAVQRLVACGALRVKRRLVHNTPVYRVEGYDVDQREALPWEAEYLGHIGTSTRVPLVPGTKIVSTTYDASCTTTPHKQGFNRENKENLSASQQPQQRSPRENYNAPTELLSENDLASAELVAASLAVVRAEIGPPLAPKEEAPTFTFNGTTRRPRIADGAP